MPRHRSLGAFWGSLCSTAVVCVCAVAFGCPTEAGAQAQLTYYAAIAVSVSSASDPDIHWGSGSWFTSQTAADQAALDRCRTRGGQSCKVEAQGSGTHIALWLSSADNVWGIAKGGSPGEAVAMAVGACMQKAAKIENCLLPPDACASSEPGSAADIDPKVVGVWELAVNGGRWILEVDPRHTYEFRSEAGDGAPASSGGFATCAGYWSSQATNGYTDAGTYNIALPDTFVATGRLGTGYWRHPANGAPPLDESEQQLYVRLDANPPPPAIWSKVGTSLIGTTASVAPPVGQAVVAYDLQPLSSAVQTNVMLRFFPTVEAAAAYVDDKNMLSNFGSDLPPGVGTFGHTDPIAQIFKDPPRFATVMQLKEKRALLRLAYREGRVVILVNTGEARPGLKANDEVSDDLFNKGMGLLGLGEFWLKQQSGRR
jgi:hypothetical protein